MGGGWLDRGFTVVRKNYNVALMNKAMDVIEQPCHDLRTSFDLDMASEF